MASDSMTIREVSRAMGMMFLGNSHALSAVIQGTDISANRNALTSTKNHQSRVTKKLHSYDACYEQGSKAAHQKVTATGIASVSVSIQRLLLFLLFFRSHYSPVNRDGLITTYTVVGVPRK